MIVLAGSVVGILSLPHHAICGIGVLFFGPNAFTNRVHTLQATVKPHCMFFLLMLLLPRPMLPCSKRITVRKTFISLASSPSPSLSGFAKCLEQQNSHCSGHDRVRNLNFLLFCSYLCFMCLFSAMKSKSAAAKNAKKGSSKKGAKKKKTPTLSKATVSATKYLKKTRVRCISGYAITTFFFSVVGLLLFTGDYFWLLRFVGPPLSDL